MKGKRLLGTANFLARAWSDRTNVEVKFMKGARFNTEYAKYGNLFGKDVYNVFVPNPNKIAPARSGFSKYRLWRYGLLHEAGHVKFTPTRVWAKLNSYDVDKTTKYFANVLEDARTAELMEDLYRGMKPEGVFFYAFARATIKAQYRGIADIFTARVKWGVPDMVLQDWDNAKELMMVQAVKEANLCLERMNAEKNPELQTNMLFRHSEKIGEILGLPKVFDHPPLDENDMWEANVPGSKLSQEVEAGIKDWAKEEDEEMKELAKNDPGEVASPYEGPLDFNAVRKGSQDAKEEYEEIKKEAEENVEEELEAIDRARATTNPAPYYDNNVIMKLKSALHPWKLGIKEIAAKRGDELDVDEYVHGNPKPFLTDELLKHKNDIMFLLDHSSSIRGMEQDYKRALIALCEAMQYLGIIFEVYCFHEVHMIEKILAIKTRSERWNEKCASKLAYISPSGRTPLGMHYTKLMDEFPRYRPKTIFTLTDGEPTDNPSVPIQKIKRAGIEMMAVGISSYNYQKMFENMKNLKYDRFAVIEQLNDLPGAVLSMLISGGRQ